MPDLAVITQGLTGDRAAKFLAGLYGNRPASLDRQRQRYASLLKKYRARFPDIKEAELFSVPGRSEVGGNHTDHNAGRVLAAAVDLDGIAVAGKTDTGLITLQSEGYPPSLVKVDELGIVESEKNTSTALVRGVCARMRALGYQVGGFSAVAASDVLKGSGLSSSAVYEVLVATILNHLYNQGKVDPILVAQIGQFAENVYFGKPCGLMDQTTCAVGGFVTIDFKDAARPLVKKVIFDFASSGYALVIVDTGGNHADLTDDYAGVEREMKSVARALGGKVLREFSLKQVLADMPRLRVQVGDRAILRAMHFYLDDQRVIEQVKALEANAFDRFLALVVESGYSSWMLNQNAYSTKNVAEQGVSLALAVSERLLKDKGAWRVHGGGFAGTIQAFVPGDQLTGYVQTMRSIFGEHSCYELTIRQAGAVKVDWTNG